MGPKRLYELCEEGKRLAVAVYLGLTKKRAKYAIKQAINEEITINFKFFKRIER
jgi:hypothetical protein